MSNSLVIIFERDFYWPGLFVPAILISRRKCPKDLYFMFGAVTDNGIKDKRAD